MGLINFILKAVILLLDLRDTYDAFDAVKLEEIGCSERQVLVRSAQDGTKHMASRRRVGTSKRKAAVKSALTTVLLWNLFCKVEPLCDRTIAWFVPFYDSFKTLFLVWMLFTRSYGASILICRILHPIVKPHEPIIDGVFELSVALFSWIAALLAPFAARCVTLAETAKAAIGNTAGSAEREARPSTAHMLAAPENEPKRKTSATSLATQARKKPPPSGPSSGSIKASPASAASSLAAGVPIVQSRVESTQTRKVPVAKASQSNLTATRRALQELPVPRHAFDSTPTKPSSSTAGPASSPARSDKASASATLTNGIETNLKTEPTEISLAPPAASLGPPSTPPTGFRNYAFIPGLTPEPSGPSSLISPTPRFPGGFSFTAASTSANPFQAQARVPPTAQMAPLTLSTQAATQSTPQDGAASGLMTHESVASANDDRIVSPPMVNVGLRKASSSRSLKGKASLQALNGKKRVRADEDADENDDGTSRASGGSTAQRKRVKSVSGPATTKKTAAAVARTQTKSLTANGQSSTTKGDPAPSKKSTAKATAAPKAPASRLNVKVASTESGSGAARETVSAITSASPQKKVESTASRPKTASTKAAAGKAPAKEAVSTSNSRSQSAEASEASEPPQRLTRSRTKQNLAD